MKNTSNNLIKLIITIVIAMAASVQYAWSVDALTKKRIAISAAIFPRIVGVDQKLHEKLDAENEAKLLIVYSQNKEMAQDVIQSIKSKVKDIAGIPVNLSIININQFDAENAITSTGIFISEQLLESQLSAIIKLCNENQRICFSPHPGDVESGIASGIFIGSQIKPFFNLSALKTGNIQINPVLLNVAKTHE